LQKPAPAVVAENDVELPVRTETNHTAVVIAACGLARVLLQRAQADQIAIEDERRAVPVIAIDAIGEERDLVDV